MNTSSNFKDLMNKEFNIKRKNRTETDSGGFTTTFQTIGTVIGRMSAEGSGTERSIGGKLQVEITHVFYTEFNADIQRDDLLEKVEDTDFIVRVIMKRNPSEINHHYEFECQRLSKPSVPTT